MYIMTVCDSKLIIDFQLLNLSKSVLTYTVKKTFHYTMPSYATGLNNYFPISKVHKFSQEKNFPLTAYMILTGFEAGMGFSRVI